MSSKYRIQCLFSLLFFNYVAGYLIDPSMDEYGETSNEKLSLEDKILDLKDDINKKFEVLGRLEDFIAKGNNETADIKNNSVATEKKLTELESSIKRTLDVIEKLPESIEKINQRLDTLEKAPKLEEQVKSLKDISEKFPATFNPKLDALTRLGSELRSNTAQTLQIINKIPGSLAKIDDRLDILEKSPIRSVPANELESKGVESEKNIIANNKLFNENLMKTETLELDDLDNSMMNQTGCKYLSLKNKEIQVFEVNNESMSLVNMAYQQLSTYRHIRRANFESHMAIRSTGNVHILLWELTKPDLSSKLYPDYEIGITRKDSFNDIVSLKTKSDSSWKGATPKFMSPDHFNKFYIKAYNDGGLELGSKCDEAPIHVHNTSRSGNVVAIGFLSTSLDGAKILYDCPATTCAESFKN